MSYPPIYIINLRRNPERKLYIQRQLDAFNLDYQFVNAVDKYDLLSKKYRTTLAHQLGLEEHNFEYLYESLGSGFFACSLSHVKVYNLMIENNIALACVLEDDGYLLPSFPEILTRCQEIPWDILMLSSQIGAVRMRIGKILNCMKSEEKFKLFKLCNYILKLIYRMRINPYMTRLILTKIVKYMLLERNTISKNEKKIMRRYPLACTCEIGALPIWKSLWHRSISNHHIARPYMHDLSSNTYNPAPHFSPTTYNPASAMAYMLTLTAAIKWKQVATSIPAKIDTIPGRLYLEKDLNLHIVTPPCVIANLNYLVYSSREIN